MKPDSDLRAAIETAIGRLIAFQDRVETNEEFQELEFIRNELEEAIKDDVDFDEIDKAINFITKGRGLK